MFKKIWITFFVLSSLDAMHTSSKWQTMIQKYQVEMGMIDLPDINALVMERGETFLKTVSRFMVLHPKKHTYTQKFHGAVVYPGININQKSGNDAAPVLVTLFAPVMRGSDYYEKRYKLLMSLQESLTLLLSHPDIDITVQDCHGMSVLDYLDGYRNIDLEYYRNLLHLFYALDDTNQKSWDAIFARMLEKI